MVHKYPNEQRPLFGMSGRPASRPARTNTGVQVGVGGQRLG